MHVLKFWQMYLCWQRLAKYLLHHNRSIHHTGYFCWFPAVHTDCERNRMEYGFCTLAFWIGQKLPKSRWYRAELLPKQSFAKPETWFRIWSCEFGVLAGSLYVALSSTVLHARTLLKRSSADGYVHIVLMKPNDIWNESREMKWKWVATRVAKPKHRLTAVSVSE